MPDGQFMLEDRLIEKLGHFFVQKTFIFRGYSDFEARIQEAYENMFFFFQPSVMHARCIELFFISTPIETGSLLGKLSCGFAC